MKVMSGRGITTIGKERDGEMTGGDISRIIEIDGAEEEGDIGIDDFM